MKLVAKERRQIIAGDERRAHRPGGKEGGGEQTQKLWAESQGSLTAERKIQKLTAELGTQRKMR